MSANHQIDVESLHIGPKIDFSSAQNVNTKTNIQIFLCKISSKVILKQNKLDLEWKKDAVF